MNSLFVLLAIATLLYMLLYQPGFYKYFFGMYFKDWNLVCADILLTSLPVLLVYLAGQKYIVSGMMTGAVKG